MSDPRGRIESLYGPTVAAGARIGVYEIVAPIGAGGMGEVYRAHDPKLGRDVAIKVLPLSFVADPDRQARFEREARLLAALNHPNIAQVYGLEESDGVLGLVMELVEGDTLADRIARGPIPIPEALPIARRIAEALAAAHEQGIIHRDLKPANVKVRPDGSVKVLDFGLAKWTESAGAADVMNSPTLSARSTQQGLILGTAAYMSPEQASGQRVDRRTDLWSFGVVLFEMLTGRRVFDGETVSHVIASVLKSEPDWSSLPRETPASVRTLLRQCLAKDSKRRLDSATAAVLDLDDSTVAAELVQRPATSDRRLARRAAPYLISAVITTAVIGAGWRWWPSTPSGISFPVTTFLEAPPGYVLGDDDILVSLPTRTPIIFTHDGRALIIQATREKKTQLFLRALDNPEARAIVGTEDARSPFLSPDGRWIGFIAVGEVKRVSVEGGVPTTICPAPPGTWGGAAGATWGLGGDILLGSSALPSPAIWRVPASGGTPVPITDVPQSNRAYTTPYFLEDGRRFLFSDVSTSDASDARLMVGSVDGGAPRVVLESATDARLLPNGQLVFMRLGTLMTARFDQRRAEVMGAPVAVMSGVMQSALRYRAGSVNTGAGMYAFSPQGTLAAIRGDLAGAGQRGPLLWVTKDGRTTPAEPAASGPEGVRDYLRISPDGSRVAATVMTTRQRGIWIFDFRRQVWSACSGCENAFGKIWAPDGNTLLLGNPGDSFIAHALTGFPPDRVVLREPGRIIDPALWLHDGRIIYVSGRPGAPGVAGTSEIKLLEPGTTAGRILATGSNSYSPALSPTGRWLAYDVRPSPPAQPSVVVQPFPGPQAVTQVATGINPAWSPDGKMLFYVWNDAVYAMDVRSDGVTFAAGTPRRLFTRTTGCAPNRCYDVAPDGRFLMNTTMAELRHESVTRMDLILNWTSTLPK